MPVSNLYTRQQMYNLLRLWNQPAKLPTTGRLVIRFPHGADFNFAVIEKSDRKSTYGQTLYALTFQQEQP